MSGNLAIFVAIRLAGATQVQPAAGHLPILARTLPRTGTNYPRNSSEISFSNSTRRRRCGNTCGRAYEHTDDSNTPALLRLNDTLLEEVEQSDNVGTR